MAFSSVTSEIQSLTISDGVQTMTLATPDLVIREFDFVTNPLGQITGWFVYVYDSDSTGEIETVNLIQGVADVGQIQTPASGPFTGVTVFGVNNGDPGTWTPLPSALPLFATGLSALGLHGWRRKRKNSAATEPPDQKIGCWLRPTTASRHA